MSLNLQVCKQMYYSGFYYIYGTLTAGVVLCYHDQELQRARPESATCFGNRCSKTTDLSSLGMNIVCSRPLWRDRTIRRRRVQRETVR